MKLQDLVRKDPKMLKLDIKAKKRKNSIEKGKSLDAHIGGSGDDAVRGMLDRSPPI